MTAASGPPDRVAALLLAGRDALASGAWAVAQTAFRSAVSLGAGVDGLEGLGIAARYLLDADGAFGAHEDGYRIAREAGDPDMSARFAVQLSYDAYAFRGPAEAVGWGERAAMLVDGRPATIATAFVPFVRAYMALLAQHDPERAQAGAAEASAVARNVGAVDLELLSVALEGLALVAGGEVTRGMAKLDAATAAAVGGEMSDADSIETVCCFVIDACKRVRDLERANEWCLRVRDIATRFGDRQMFSVCRVHYADVLMWQGDFVGAGAELAAATDELGRIRPGREADALVRLAELRRRQGRTDEAQACLARSETHRFHALVSGLIALDRGDAQLALDAADRFLRRIGPTDLFERVAGLELAVRSAIAAGDREHAAEAAAEIERIAAGAASGALRAAALLAAGRRAFADGDARAARTAIEDAAALFDDAEARYDAALARNELAAVLRIAGDEDGARREELRARRSLDAMGAYTGGGSSGPLSARETEVLRLLAQGLSNGDIAHRLVLSVRTAERHVANIYGKIGASGRTARAIATAWAHSHGIT